MQKPEDILSQVRSFMLSRAILTAAELDLFTELDKKPQDASSLAQTTHTEQRALRRLLDCLVAHGILGKKAGGYFLAEPFGVLSADHQESILPMVLHQNDCWRNWSHLTQTVRQGTNPEIKNLEDTHPEQLHNFIQAMHVVSRSRAWEIARKIDLHAYSNLLDIGAGPGTYTAAFLQQYPDMHAILFDLPQVIPMAQKKLQQMGLLSRVKLVAGDYLQDEFPAGCDLALLSSIIHQNSPRENSLLYAKIHQALLPGGRLLIRDIIMNQDRTSPPAGTLFALNMLVNTPAGDTYTYAEVNGQLKEAGFSEVKLLHQGEGMDSLVQADKKA